MNGLKQSFLYTNHNQFHSNELNLILFMPIETMDNNQLIPTYFFEIIIDLKILVFLQLLLHITIKLSNIIISNGSELMVMEK